MPPQIDKPSGRELSGGWIKFNRRQKCPVCNKSDCVISPDGGTVICYREKSDRVTSHGHYIHVLSYSQDWEKPKRKEFKLDLPPNWTDQYAKIESATDPEKRAEFAEKLGVSRKSLEDQEVAWSNKYRGWSWPMKWIIGDSTRVVGVRVRTRRGKISAKGSRGGLFLPKDFMERRVLEDFIVVAEGPTSAAAALSMGFLAIGISSVGADLEMAAKACEDCYAVVVPDNGSVGIDSGNRLREALDKVCIGTSIIAPPVGVDDLRDWSKSASCVNVIKEFGKMATL